MELECDQICWILNIMKNSSTFFERACDTVGLSKSETTIPPVRLNANMKMN